MCNEIDASMYKKKNVRRAKNTGIPDTLVGVRERQRRGRGVFKTREKREFMLDDLIEIISKLILLIV